MRIAYVTADRGIPVFGEKGASVHVRAMVNAFADSGHTLDVFAARRGPQSAPLAANIIKVIPSASEMVGFQTVQDNKTVAKEHYSMAVSHCIEAEIIARHQENPFDFIYERYALFSTSGVRAAANLGIPCAVEVNSPLVVEQEQYRSLSNIGRAREIECEVFSRASELFCVSSQMQDYALEHGASANATTIVPNAIDPDRFKPSGPCIANQRTDGKFIVGFVGSLKSWHGINILIEAFREFAREYEDSHLLIVGDGPKREWFEGYLAGSSLEDRVTLTGWLPHDELPLWLRAMDVAVAPYPELEGFYFSPLKLYEYLACGVPVVASRIGQIDSALDHNKNALLVDPGSTVGLHEALAKLYLDESLRNRLSTNGCEAVRDQTWKRNANVVVQTLVRNRQSQILGQKVQAR